MTADEVIAALRAELQDALLWINGQPSRSNCKADTFTQLVDNISAALDLARSYRGWRSIEQEKPADGQRVIVLSPFTKKVELAKWNGDKFCSAWFEPIGAELWHPLPEPPKP